MESGQLLCGTDSSHHRSFQKEGPALEESHSEGLCERSKAEAKVSRIRKTEDTGVLICCKALIPLPSAVSETLATF